MITFIPFSWILLKSFILFAEFGKMGDFFLNWKNVMMGILENANFINVQLFQGYENSVIKVRFFQMVFSAM